MGCRPERRKVFLQIADRFYPGGKNRMLKIFGAPHSRAFRVIWLANEIGIPYEHIPVTFSVPNAQCKEPWYLALNPNGLVPTIDDGGFVMWETAAINLYLAETYKNSLYPSTPQSRGRMLQWTFFATTEVEPPLITLFRNRIFYPPEQRNETLAAQAEQTLRAKLAILEDQLAKPHLFFRLCEHRCCGPRRAYPGQSTLDPAGFPMSCPSWR
jgi:glutathione S-transferase